jgi:phytoene dehydrogenase-like protein
MPDAIVVGAGPNGLAAAITLAEAGRSVTLLEAADRVGGAVATQELTLPGFRHDTFSAVYPAAAASPVFARWLLERHGLRWSHPRLVGGDVGAGSYALDQTVFRPLPSLTPYRTPVRGLYLGSASTFPGGAVHGVPGHAAARLALLESRLPGARRRA